MTFNVYGNLESKNNLKATGDVKNAYGKRQVYGESYASAYGEHTRYKNKIISSSATNKYVKNYLKNTSFEGDNILFNASANTELTIVGDMYESGIKSLKVVNTANNETITQEVSVPKGDNYTFSAYLKNSNKIRLALGYIDSSNELIENTSEIIDSTENFDRQDVTINYPEDANGNLIIKIYLDETGITYIDDIQLEEGEVANKYNMVENSDFSEGLTGWTLQCNKLLTGTEINQSDVFEIIDLPSNNKALKIAMNPANYSSFKKEFNINGFAGDTYNISFWYKDEGYVGEVGYGSSIINDTSIWFNYTDTSDGFGVFSSKIFTPNESEWQYFSGNFVALKDYDKMTLEFSQRFNANNFYITDICLFKDAREVNYDYDENGNIKFVHNLNNKTATYNYDKNAQLINVVDYQNKDFTFEYDKNAPEKLLHGISNMGISSKLKYDEDGNPIYNSIKSISNNVSEGLYKIRLKGTDKFIGCINNSIHIKENCSHDLWKIEKVDDYYKISHSILYEKYLSVENSNLVLSSFNNDTSLFSLIRKEDGSYLVKMKNDDKYLNQSNDNVSISEIIEDDYNYEFFIEKLNSNIFVENNSQYSEDGRFIVSTTDTLLNKTLYNVDPNTGLLLSITNAKGHTINYNYDDCKKLTSISEANKVVIYGYDSNNMLSTITQNNKQYKFSYDDFFRVKNVSLGENILFVTNNYESNNGNLNSMTFGNNQIISYSYDDFDRLICVRCMDDVYNYKYDNNGDLVKIISNDAVVKFVYNLAKELVEYRYNDFKIKYIYDVDDKIVETQYKLGDFTGVVGNVFNNDGEISSISFEGSNYNYNYDPLGRISSANINNKFNITYEYITNGNRTSFIIKKISIGEDIYLYKYDKLNNITHIYHNNKLENKYYYDEYNELIKENNYVNKTTTKYEYDICGNILSQKVYDLYNYNIISQKNYGYNNSNWEDQLTNFNDEIISYDEIGNPISIGEDTILTWINGRQLRSYEDSNNIITYKYNSDGIRIEKEVNNVKTHYYLQGEDIILEKNNNDVIYYIRNNMDGLVGFKYNNNLYYYLKNVQNDIIGILDNECNIVAKYTYDSWGNHVSIVDGNGNDVSNEAGHIANINSFRYRCYYYDKETGLYYLKLRYYNPKWGRFLNPDSILGANKDIISFNLYGYCSNNPIMYTDESGKGIFKSIVKTVKKAAKAVKKAVKKVVTVVKNVTKKVVNAVTNSVSKPAKAEQKKSGTKTSPTPAKQEVDTSSLPDYTEELNKVLIANTAQAITISDSFSGKNALSYFYEQVKSGGPWDYKLKEKWEEDIDVPFLGYDGKFLYNGKVTSAEDFGNIHYGFVGTAMGMEPELLYMGGGYAAEGGFSIRMIIPPHYGDSENDHESIKRGIDMYYNWE